jgi:hypothetical protein
MVVLYFELVNAGLASSMMRSQCEELFRDALRRFPRPPFCTQLSVVVGQLHDKLFSPTIELRVDDV